MGAIAEAFVSFAQPLLNQTDGSEDQVKKAFAISQLCYSLALLPEDSRDATLSEMRSSLKMDDKEFDAFRRSIVDPMIRRHHAMFPRLHQRVCIDPIPSGRSLEEYPPATAPAGKYPVADRYAPCPCNSGRKFKFCCGANGR